MSARADMLAAIRQALARSPDPTPEPLAYRRQGVLAPEALAGRFLERLCDYDVAVTVAERAGDIAATVEQRLKAFGVQRVAAPEDLPGNWRPEGAQIVDDRSLDSRALDETPASLTGCALAVAETGSIVLDGGFAQGRRALTLLPDRHLCVVFADQLVETVPEAIQALGPAARAKRVLTVFSGPSATADIEFDRVVGVHGPRKLDVIFVRQRG